MLNVFIAVVVENMSVLSRKENSVISDESFQRYAPCMLLFMRWVTKWDRFQRAWAIFDPAATGFIHLTKLEPVLRMLKPPLGISPLLPPVATARTMAALKIPISDSGMIQFHHTLYGVCERVEGVAYVLAVGTGVALMFACRLPKWHSKAIERKLRQFMPPHVTSKVLACAYRVCSDIPAVRVHCSSPCCREVGRAAVPSSQSLSHACLRPSTVRVVSIAFLICMTQVASAFCRTGETGHTASISAIHPLCGTRRTDAASTKTRKHPYAGFLIRSCTTIGSSFSPSTASKYPPAAYQYPATRATAARNSRGALRS